MPHFYFDVQRSGLWQVDDYGLEIATSAEAERHGVRELIELVADQGRATRPLRFPFEMKIRVRERGVLRAQEVSITIRHTAG